ncbi:hypothetical protein ACFLWC_07195 [Chloroflexota bacterium]
MTELPKLKIKKHFGQPVEEKICDLEEAQYFLLNYLPSAHGAGILVTVEGQLIHSYEELVRIANQDFYKDKEFLEVGIYPALGGG